jgi:Zn-dependent protease with chaperone function
LKVQPTGVSTTQTSLSGQPPIIRPSTTAEAMQVLIFGKRPPKLVDKRKYPKLKKGLKRLANMKDEIAEILGRSPEDFTLELCEGNNACINRDGQIAVGVDLLGEHQEDDDLLVAVMGHEMGHQPWTWPNGNVAGLTRAQLNHLCREEEAKADRFAGRVLAALDASPERICQFLKAAEGFEQHKSQDYYAADIRAAMIEEAFAKRIRRAQAGRAVFGGTATRALR